MWTFWSFNLQVWSHQLAYQAGLTRSCLLDNCLTLVLVLQCNKFFYIRRRRMIFIIELWQNACKTVWCRFVFKSISSSIWLLLEAQFLGLAPQVSPICSVLLRGQSFCPSSGLSLVETIQQRRVHTWPVAVALECSPRQMVGIQTTQLMGSCSRCAESCPFEGQNRVVSFQASADVFLLLGDALQSSPRTLGSLCAGWRVTSSWKQSLCQIQGPPGIGST